MSEIQQEEGRMAHAYTPGLKVTGRTLIRKTRILPLKGEVLVVSGDRVEAEQVMARTQLPGDVLSVNVAGQLGVPASELTQYLLKNTGDGVREGEVIAENKPLIKWFKTQVISPVEGSVVSVSDVTGQVLLRKPPRPIELCAYISGTVVDIEQGSGVTVETSAALIQGIFGVGGEKNGILKIAVDSPDRPLSAADILPEHRGQVLVGGSLVEREALVKACELQVAAIVCGGVKSSDLRNWLGSEIGVAVTGDETVETTLVLTEGFGQITMSRKAFDLFCGHEGMKASVSGRTQIRAGVMRPEVVIPFQEAVTKTEIVQGPGGIEVGSRVRIIRAPLFGRLGNVAALPPQPVKIETEATVRVMEIELDGGEKVTVPRANVEAVEG